MAIKWNSSIEFPTDSNFENRITDVKFGPSNSSGNPMVTMEFEVVEPGEVEVGEQVVNISGVGAKQYFTTEVKDPKTGEIDEKKTVQGRQRLVALLSNLGMDTGLGLDLDMQNFEQLNLAQCNLNWDNLGPQLLPLKGRIVLCHMYPEVEEKTKTPTAKQVEEGLKKGLKKRDIKGDVMKNPITGKVLINYWPKIGEIFGAKPGQDTIMVEKVEATA